MASKHATTEGQILEDIIGSDGAELTPQVAEFILQMKFKKNASKRISQLLRKNNRGTITPIERATLEKYLRVGQFMDLLQAKVKLYLQRAANQP
jgi:hypothetical protein